MNRHIKKYDDIDEYQGEVTTEIPSYDYNDPSRQTLKVIEEVYWKNAIERCLKDTENEWLWDYLNTWEKNKTHFIITGFKGNSTFPTLALEFTINDKEEYWTKIAKGLNLDIAEHNAANVFIMGGAKNIAGDLNLEIKTYNPMQKLKDEDNDGIEPSNEIFSINTKQFNDYFNETVSVDNDFYTFGHDELNFEMGVNGTNAHSVANSILHAANLIIAEAEEYITNLNNINELIVSPDKSSENIKLHELIHQVVFENLMNEGVELTTSHLQEQGISCDFDDEFFYQVFQQSCKPLEMTLNDLALKTHKIAKNIEKRQGIKKLYNKDIL